MTQQLLDAQRQLQQVQYQLKQKELEEKAKADEAEGSWVYAKNNTSR